MKHNKINLQDKLEEILELYMRQVLKEENRQFVNYERLNKKEATQAILTALEAYVQTAERKARIDEIGRRIGGENWTQEEVDFAIQIGMLSQNEIERLASLRSNKGEK